MVDEEKHILEAMKQLIYRSKELKAEHDKVIREFSRLARKLEKIRKNGLVQHR